MKYTRLINKLVIIFIVTSISCAMAMEQTKKQIQEKGLSFSMLKLSHSTELQKVALPYPYKHLSNEEREKTLWVPEFFYATLDDKSKHDYILVDDLGSSIVIFIQNEVNQRIAVFHKNCANSIDNVINNTQHELEITDPTKVRILVFAHDLSDDEQKIEGNCIITSYTQKENYYNGKNLREELLFIKNSLLKGFKIDDRQQVSARLFMIDRSTEKSLLLSDYMTAYRSLVIGKNFTVNNICPIHEKIFGNFDCYSELERVFKIRKTKQEAHIKLVTKYFPQLSVSGELAYNSIHFEKLC